MSVWDADAVETPDERRRKRQQWLRARLVHLERPVPVKVLCHECGIGARELKHLSDAGKNAVLLSDAVLDLVERFIGKWVSRAAEFASWDEAREEKPPAPKPDESEKLAAKQKKQAYDREYRRRNKAKFTAYRRKYQARTNARKRAEYAANPMPTRARNRASYLRHTEKRKSNVRAWVKRNWEIVRAKKAAYREKRREYLRKAALKYSRELLDPYVRQALYKTFRGTRSRESFTQAEVDARREQIRRRRLKEGIPDCPHCGSAGRKDGKIKSNGKQRFSCKWCKKTYYIDTEQSKIAA